MASYEVLALEGLGCQESGISTIVLVVMLGLCMISESVDYKICIAHHRFMYSKLLVLCSNSIISDRKYFTHIFRRKTNFLMPSYKKILHIGPYDA